MIYGEHLEKCRFDAILGTENHFMVMHNNMEIDKVPITLKSVNLNYSRVKLFSRFFYKRKDFITAVPFTKILGALFLHSYDADDDAKDVVD